MLLKLKWWNNDILNNDYNYCDIFRLIIIIFIIRIVTDFISSIIFHQKLFRFYALGTVIIMSDILNTITILMITILIISILTPAMIFDRMVYACFGVILISWSDSRNNARGHYCAPCTIRPGGWGLCWHYGKDSIRDLVMGRGINPFMALLPATENFGFRLRREYWERFPHHPRVSDPDMHHGTCVRHVPLSVPGFLTSGFLWGRWQGKSSRHPRSMPNTQLCVSGKRPIDNR